MIQVPTAQEARALSSSIENTASEKQLTQIASAIKEAAARGFTSTSVAVYASLPVEEELRRLGYEVKKWDDQRDGAYTYVSW